MSFKNFELVDNKQVIAFSRKRMTDYNVKIREVLNGHGADVPKSFTGMNVPDLNKATKWVKAHPAVVKGSHVKRTKAWDEQHGVNDNQVLAYEMLHWSFPLLKSKSRWIDTVKFYRQHPDLIGLYGKLTVPDDYYFKHLLNPAYSAVSPEMAKDWRNMKLTATDKSQMDSLSFKLFDEQRLYVAHCTQAERIGFFKHGNGSRENNVTVNRARIWFKGTDFLSRKVLTKLPAELAKAIGVAPEDTATEKAYWGLVDRGYYCEDFLSHADGSTFVKNPKSLDDVDGVMSMVQLRMSDHKGKSLTDKLYMDTNEMLRYSGLVLINYNSYVDAHHASQYGLPEPEAWLDTKSWGKKHGAHYKVANFKDDVRAVRKDIKAVKAQKDKDYQTQMDAKEAKAHAPKSLTDLKDKLRQDLIITTQTSDFKALYDDIMTMLNEWSDTSPYPSFFDPKTQNGLSRYIYTTSHGEEMAYAKSYTFAKLRSDLQFTINDCEKKLKAIKGLDAKHPDIVKAIHYKARGANDKKRTEAVKAFTEYFGHGQKRSDHTEKNGAQLAGNDVKRHRKQMRANQKKRTQTQEKIKERRTERKRQQTKADAKASAHRKPEQLSLFA